MTDAQKEASRLLGEAKHIMDQPMTMVSELTSALEKSRHAVCIINALHEEARKQPRPKVGD